jgi:two-component system, NtrC family, sensor kinase
MAMKSMPPAARWYLVLLWLSGAILILLSLRHGIPAELWVILLAALPIYILADYYEFRMERDSGDQFSMTIVDAPTLFLAAVAGPPGLAVIVSGTVIVELLHRKPWYKLLFNVALRSLIYVAVTQIHMAIVPAEAPPFAGLPGLIAFVAMAVSYYGVNTLLVATVLGFSSGQKLSHVLYDCYRTVHWVHFATMPFGALSAVVWHYNPWLVVLGGLPLVLLRRWFKTLADLRAETRRSEELARQSRQLADRLERLQSAATAMIGTTDPDVLLATVSGHLAAVLEAEAHWVILLDDGPRLAAGGMLPEAWSWNPAAYVEALNQAEVRIEDAAGSRRLHPMAELPWQSLLLIPLVLAPRTLGAICLATSRPARLADEDRRVLLAFAAQAALAAERARLFAELRTKQDELIRSSKLAALGTFAAGIGHEFNNLLAGMLGFAQLGLASDDVREKDEALEVAVRLSMRGRSITGGLLTFARRRDSQRVAYLIGMVVEETLALVERELAKENITLVRRLEPVPETLCDPGQIAQVILNLINNARDAMREQGGGTLTVTLTQRERQVELTIGDTGHGIPEQLLDQIFQPFVTTKGALNGSATPGTGLGLAISHGIVESHGGTLEARSSVGAGTTMIVRLPIVAPQPPEAPAPVKHDLPHLRILLVDDEPDVAVALARLLESHGQEVSVAENAEVALRAYGIRPFDLVISDVVMPSIGGIELVRRLRALDPQVAFLAISGHDATYQVDQLIEAGTREVLRKPFTVAELLDAIARATRAPSAIASR